MLVEVTRNRKDANVKSRHRDGEEMTMVVVVIMVIVMAVLLGAEPSEAVGACSRQKRWKLLPSALIR